MADDDESAGRAVCWAVQAPPIEAELSLASG